jgi:hypothetical protein
MPGTVDFPGKAASPIVDLPRSAILMPRLAVARALLNLHGRFEMPTHKNRSPHEDEPEAIGLDANELHSPVEPVDPEVEREFHATDAQSRSGGRWLARQLREDVGDEGPGGTAATPDPGVVEQVEEVGKAQGLTFEDNEPVDAPGKMERRDRNRWELQPASAEDFKERQSQE